jgi:hypothetical protein
MCPELRELFYGINLEELAEKKMLSKEGKKYNLLLCL